MGERGAGKSALMFYLMEDLKRRGVYPVLIDEYDGIPIKNNGREFLFLVEQNIVTCLSIELICDKTKIRMLKKDDREKLAFLINIFFKNITKNKVKELYEEVSKTKKINMLKQLCNAFLIKPINVILSGTSSVVGSTVSKALGLPVVDNNVVYQQFISELSKDSQLKDYSEINYKDLKEILRETALIIEKLGYKKLVIFFDKIDEYIKLKSQIDSIVEFIASIATDTSLIYSSEFGFEFLLWNKLKDKMKEKQVRFDKSRPIDINWDKTEMKKMLSRRLEYFAVHRSNVNEILGDEQQLNKIIEMANGSPRQLTMLLARIYEEQSKIDASINSFSEEAVKLGMQNFSQTFEYELFFPGMHIKDVVNRILKVGKMKFSINDLASATKKSPQTASNWIRTMKNIGFVEEIEGDSGKAKIYSVIDPKIIYMIENKLNYVG